MKIAVIVLFVGLASMALANDPTKFTSEIAGDNKSIEITWMNSKASICAAGSTVKEAAQVHCGGAPKSVSTVTNDLQNKQEISFKMTCTGQETSYNDCTRDQTKVCDQVVAATCQ